MLPTSGVMFLVEESRLERSSGTTQERRSAPRIRNFVAGLTCVVLNGIQPEKAIGPIEWGPTGRDLYSVTPSCAELK